MKTSPDYNRAMRMLSGNLRCEHSIERAQNTEFPLVI